MVTEKSIKKFKPNLGCLTLDGDGLRTFTKPQFCLPAIYVSVHVLQLGSGVSLTCRNEHDNLSRCDIRFKVITETVSLRLLQRTLKRKYATANRGLSKV
ncbi:hypothetical protein AVEN_173683-1 [Araneus ventricosus]|uniref:Uncharacterized protein n=1 Tax=Araneus ventricosus TaxID=182803 RepID=A0A4Y2Q228_ARAVE|nr:hypothetical protein AVEN_173683-1 [Araneus ventricosus]